MWILDDSELYRLSLAYACLSGCYETRTVDATCETRTFSESPYLRSGINHLDKVHLVQNQVYVPLFLVRPGHLQD